ncbi:MAG: AraC family transcriptional regulator [Thermoleophilaceae bacterium]|nr:AraC family transcriptional regulator [Thermoleophilaceae bacterium]
MILAARQPYDAPALLAFLAKRAVPGVEEVLDGRYRRSLRLPHGDGTVELSAADGAAEVRAVFELEDLRDLTAAIARCRHLLDLDADPVAVDGTLGADPLMRELVARTPGIRMAGAADGFELAVRAVVGQQVSVAAARTVAGKLVRAAGGPTRHPRPPVTHTFPSPEALAALAQRAPAAFPMPASRRRTLAALAEAAATGELASEPGADPQELEARLLALPGIGPWTAGYVAMRALGDPDAFLPTDLGVRRAVAELGGPDDPRSISALAERWRPWRAYAVAHLWTALSDPIGGQELGDRAAGGAIASAGA